MIMTSFFALSDMPVSVAPPLKGKAVWLKATAALAMIGILSGGVFLAVSVPMSRAATILTDEEAALTAAKNQSNAAKARSAALEREATNARSAADRARAATAAVAARVQSIEADINAGEARLALIERAQAIQAAALADRQEPIVRLTGMLQTLSRKPPIAVFAQPGSIDDLAHARAILSAAIPEIERRTVGLRAEMAKSRALKQEAEMALGMLTRDRERLANERAALSRLETERRIQSRSLMAGADTEETRAIALGEKARDIIELMDSLRVDGEVREALAELDGPIMRPAEGSADNDARAAFPARAIVPATPAAASRLAYRLPVVGEIETGLGEVSASGVRSRGLSIATQAGAQVVAPANGRVVFTGPYRGFGNILIIEHSGGWTTLITHMITSSVKVGDPLVAGDPVGRTGAGRPVVTIELRKNGEPQDITALLS